MIHAYTVLIHFLTWGLPLAVIIVNTLLQKDQVHVET